MDVKLKSKPSMEFQVIRAKRSRWRRLLDWLRRFWR